MNKYQAIELIEISRKTHIQWIEWYEKYPEHADAYPVAGDMQHHIDCIARYDKVIAYLEQVSEKEI